jgi:hypothetical protein
MKIPLGKREHGSVLVTALILCAVMGIVIGSFLTLTSSRSISTMRSQAWNSAIPVLEAGIEEALTHLHADSSPEANGWTPIDVNGKTIYQKRRDFPSDVGYCVVTISNYASNPVIYSRGVVPAPRGQGDISRMVRVTTKTSGPLPYALLAQRQIQFNSSTYFVKSFNSEDPNYSTNGLFILSKSRANANVLTLWRDPAAINVGNALIYGRVGTGAGGTVVTGPNGVVGDQSWVSDPANLGTIQSGHITEDVNIDISQNSLPKDHRWLPPLINAPINGTNYAYVIANGDYMLGKASIAGNGVMYVVGDCSLYIENDFTVSGNGLIYIAPNSSLKLYVGGSCYIGGGGIVNNTGVAKNFSIIGLPTCASVGYSGGSDFIGTINAPGAHVAFGGGANIVGAVIGNTITLGGSGYFVYDEALGKGDSKFTITSYREL